MCKKPNVYFWDGSLVFSQGSEVNTVGGRSWRGGEADSDSFESGEGGGDCEEGASGGKRYVEQKVGYSSKGRI